MAVRAQAFKAPVAQTTRVTMPRTAFAKAPLRMSRPAQLQSEFLSPVASLKGLCASFTRKFDKDITLILWIKTLHLDVEKLVARVVPYDNFAMQSNWLAFLTHFFLTLIH